VLRIRNVYPGSDFFTSRIRDPNCLYPGSRLCIKEFKFFNPQKTKKWYLSSRKYDPGCSSRIPDPDADFLPIPDPGSRGQKTPDPGSRNRIRNTGSDHEPELTNLKGRDPYTDSIAILVESCAPYI